MDRALTGTAVAGGSDQPVVEQPVGLVPQALLVQGVADAREVLQELQHQVLRLAAAGPGEDAAMASMASA